ncbi:MAG: hypothetical protein CMJ78_18410 [Planctomycetaceae bacterium]|nr:hypothetical protein [Planctomycetaceae bacterium]
MVDIDRDLRLYVPDTRWQVDIKRSGDKEYCSVKTPNEDYFHLLMQGEIYIHRGIEKCCLNCATRLGITTDERLFWQKRDGLTIPEK